MQQVATSRLDIAATGNQQAKAEQKQSGGSEFSQIFEQNQRTNNTSNASRDRQAAEQRNSNSHKTDTRPTATSEAKRTDLNRVDKDAYKSEAAERTTETKPVQSAQAEKGSGADSNGKQTAIEGENKEIRIHAASANEESGAQQDVSEQVSEHLSLESELQDLGDGEHTQWVNLLNQLLSKQGEEFDDGGAAADPFAVDVGQLVEGEPQKQRTKDVDEEIVITLPELPEAETLEVNPKIASQVDLQTELTPEMLVSNELPSVSSINPELATELQDLVSQLDENDLQQLEENELQQLEENELQQLMEENTELKQLLADMLAQVDNSASDDAPAEISLQKIDATPQVNEAVPEELSSIDSMLLATLLFTKEQPSDSLDSNTENTDTLVTNAESKVTLEGGNAELVAQLEQMLSSNKEKLISAENLLSRLQSNGSTDKATADFVASLQAGIKEFKEQLKAGHQPGIDLQALVGDAMASIDSQAGMKAMQEQLSGALQQMSSVIQLAQGIDQADRDTLLSTMQSSLRTQSDVASSTLEANRQGQLLQSQVDKAINIAKPEAAQQLAKQVQVMVNQKNMVAEIRLDPPDLGSMKINISMQGDTASVNIVVQSQQARDMLEQNTPRLRELLEEQGIELGQSSVQEESAGDKEANETQFAGNSGSGEGSEEELESEQAELNRHVNVAKPDGIDYFA
ncbi:MAG: flagellar hook-length control protein FliK [Aestuariibacter sp.]